MGPLQLVKGGGAPEFLTSVVGVMVHPCFLDCDMRMFSYGPLLTIKFISIISIHYIGVWGYS